MAQELREEARMKEEPKRFLYASWREVFAANFRVVEAGEAAELRERFETPLTPLYVARDGAALVAQNQLPGGVSLAADVFAGLRTDQGCYVVRYREGIGRHIYVSSFAGDGINTHNSAHWWSLETLASAQEAGLYGLAKLRMRESEAATI